MKFYDLCIEPEISSESEIKEMIKFAEELGYSGISIAIKFENAEKFKDFKILIESIETTLEIYTAAKISTRETAELKRLIDSARNIADIIIVEGGDYNINRAACEDPKVDVLLNPEKGRIDCGLDEACMNFAKRNGVSIGINFREILMTYRRMRASLIQNLMKNIMLSKKFGAGIVICSCAKTKWEMRGARELIAIGQVLGLEFGNSFSCLSDNPQNILIKNRKKLEGKIITDGVELA